jgi:hypothetical protein
MPDSVGLTAVTWSVSPVHAVSADTTPTPSVLLHHHHASVKSPHTRTVVADEAHVAVLAVGGPAGGGLVEPLEPEEADHVGERGLEGGEVLVAGASLLLRRHQDTSALRVGQTGVLDIVFYYYYYFYFFLGFVVDDETAKRDEFRLYVRWRGKRTRR